MISWFIAFSLAAAAACIQILAGIRRLSEPPARTAATRSAGYRERRPRRSRILLLCCLGGRTAVLRLLGVVQVDIEAERAHLLDQHVEAFGNARFERVVATHDRLVHLGTAGDVVRLHGEHFLERVGRAVGLERPHLHFAETLAAELRLAAERLLGDQRVRTDRTGVY